MTEPADSTGGRRRVIFQEEVAPAEVYGVWPVTALAGFALVVAVIATVAAGHLRHTMFWWLPAGSWTAVAIGCYGMWHMRWHRSRLRAESAGAGTAGPGSAGPGSDPAGAAEQPPAGGSTRR